MMYVVASLVSILALGFLLLTLVGLPGTWGMVVMAVLLAWLVPQEVFTSIPWIYVAVLVGLALLGELVEFVASAAGVGKLGGSRRAATLAIVGSLVGAIVGMVVGLPIPIPVVGSLIGSIILGGVGAAVGALIGERMTGKAWDGSVKIGMAAFVGRIFGTVGKTFCAAIMAAMLIVLVWVK
jgi:uncharacterized protein YqgC (DUF456 family)